MTTINGSELMGAEFADASLHGARFVRCDVSGMVLRAVHIDGTEIDAPWLSEGGSLVVNGVDVAPLVEAELDRRFPGRATRTATEPEALRAAWEHVQAAWADVIARVAAMPAGTVDVAVDGEWSFAQTLRHLVMATDTWLGRAIRGQGAEAYHPLGQPHAEYETDGYDLAVFHQTDPTYDTVLEVRAERAQQVRDYLAAVTPDQLQALRRSPWSADHQEPVLACLHTILGEEWEHLRYAVRDLDLIEARAAASPPSA